MNVNGRETGLNMFVVLYKSLYTVLFCDVDILPVSFLFPGVMHELYIRTKFLY
jgi:hypothetical protein